MFNTIWFMYIFIYYFTTTVFTMCVFTVFGNDYCFLRFIIKPTARKKEEIRKESLGFHRTLVDIMTNITASSAIFLPDCFWFRTTTCFARPRPTVVISPVDSLKSARACE